MGSFEAWRGRPVVRVTGTGRGKTRARAAAAARGRRRDARTTTRARRGGVDEWGVDALYTFTFSYAYAYAFAGDDDGGGGRRRRGRRGRMKTRAEATGENGWLGSESESESEEEEEGSDESRRRHSTSRRTASTPWKVAAETSGAYGEAARGGRGRGSGGRYAQGGRGRGRGRGEGRRDSSSSRSHRGDGKRKKSSGGSGGGNRAEREHIQMNSTITKLQTVDELLDYANDRADEMNVINLATCMHRLGRLNAARNRGAGGAARDPAVAEDARFQTLTNRLRELLIAAQDGTLEGKGLGTFKVRPLSAICWGSA